MRKKLGLLLLALALMFTFVSGAGASCQTYDGLAGYEGNLTYGPYCANSGGGCTECIDWNPGPGVWFNICYYDLWSGNVYCFSQGIENQGL